MSHLKFNLQNNLFVSILFDNQFLLNQNNFYEVLLSTQQFLLLHFQFFEFDLLLRKFQKELKKWNAKVEFIFNLDFLKICFPINISIVKFFLHLIQLLMKFL